MVRRSRNLKTEDDQMKNLTKTIESAAAAHMPASCWGKYKRIRKGVKPFGRRRVEVVREDERFFTVLPPHPAQPIERIYRRYEIEED